MREPLACVSSNGFLCPGQKAHRRRDDDDDDGDNDDERMLRSQKKTLFARDGSTQEATSLALVSLKRGICAAPRRMMHHRD